VAGRQRGIVGVLGVALDITRRAHAEAALLRSERTLAEFFENAETELFENAVIGLHWIGADGTILRANQAELILLGYAVEEYVGHHIAEFHVDPELVTEILARLGRGETVDAWEARMRAGTARSKDVLISSNALWEDGHFVRTRGFTRDITDRRRMRRHGARPSCSSTWRASPTPPPTRSTIRWPVIYGQPRPHRPHGGAGDEAAPRRVPRGDRAYRRDPGSDEQPRPTQALAGLAGRPAAHGSISRHPARRTPARPAEPRAALVAPRGRVSLIRWPS